MYAVLRLIKEATVETVGVQQALPLVLAEGMVGAIPVFEKLEDAEKYAGDKFKIMEIQSENGSDNQKEEG